MLENLCCCALKKGDRNLPRALDHRGVLTLLTLLMLAVSAGCASTPQVRSEADRQADRATADRVYEALAADPLAVDYFRLVHVSVRDGVVTLSGFLLDRREIFRAQRITARVPGVRRVVDQLEVDEDHDDLF